MGSDVRRDRDVVSGSRAPAAAGLPHLGQHLGPHRPTAKDLGLAGIELRMKSGDQNRTVAGRAMLPVGRPWAAAVLAMSIGCRSEGAPPVAHAETAAGASTGTSVAQSPAEPPASAAAASPVPKALANVAAQFGLSVLAKGWSWTAIDRNKTRFDWAGRTERDDREVLLSFWLEKMGETERKFLVQLVDSAARNLTLGTPCPPFDQPPEITKLLGVERIITECFDPAPYMSKVHSTGVLHGIVNKGALTIVVVLSKNRASIVPLAEEIGARGVP